MLYRLNKNADIMRIAFSNQTVCTFIRTSLLFIPLLSIDNMLVMVLVIVMCSTGITKTNGEWTTCFLCYGPLSDSYCKWYLMCQFDMVEGNFFILICGLYSCFNILPKFTYYFSSDLLWNSFSNYVLCATIFTPQMYSQFFLIIQFTDFLVYFFHQAGGYWIYW